MVNSIEEEMKKCFTAYHAIPSLSFSTRETICDMPFFVPIKLQSDKSQYFGTSPGAMPNKTIMSYYMLSLE